MINAARKVSNRLKGRQKKEFRKGRTFMFQSTIHMRTKPANQETTVVLIRLLFRDIIKTVTCKTE
jgi:hypothetical protein